MAFIATAAAAMTLFASPSFATKMIKVVESGEGGGAMSLKLDQASGCRQAPVDRSKASSGQGKASP
jgi:hypothetical protein